MFYITLMDRETMTRQNRMRLIKKIERTRGSRLLVYYTGDRQGQETRISSDIHPFCFEHLQSFGDVDKIDLFVYTPGGITMAGFGLVNLIREFCNNFSVIIPFRALSCGTLISLGANEIVMTKLGQLSPIDPSIDHPLGPQAEIQNQKYNVPVNVEDAISFIKLAKEEADIKNENELGKVFEKLALNVHPLTLGAVGRSRAQISFLAKTLLSYHIKNDEKIERIIDTLIHQRFSHDYLIGRKEAEEILNLNIIKAESINNLDKTILELHKEYNDILELNVPYHPELYLGADNQCMLNLNRAIMESNNKTHCFRTRARLERITTQLPPSPLPVTGYQTNLLGESWILDNTL
jgi:hypothetical protein